MSDEDKNCLHVSSEMSNLGETSIVDFADENFVKSKDEENLIMDHKYYGLVKTCYPESWTTFKNSSLETQHSYPDKNSIPTKIPSVGEAPKSHCQTQIQSRLILLTDLSSRSDFETNNLLHIGDQFYGQTDQNQNEVITQQNFTASSESLVSTETYDSLLLDLQELMDSYQNSEHGS